MVVAISTFPLPTMVLDQEQHPHNAVWWYFYCYDSLLTTTEESSRNTTIAIDTCCGAIERAAEAVVSYTKENDVRIPTSLCPQQLTALPLSSQVSRGTSPIRPTWAWISPLISTIPISIHGWFPPPVSDKTAASQSCYIWDDATKELVHSHKNATIGTTDWRDGAESMAKLDPSIWIPLYNREDGTAILDDDNRAFRATMDSSLVGTGMHRSMNQKFHFVYPKPFDEPYNISLDLLIHLPSDLFVNMEDAITCRHIQNCQISWMGLIDQEEPTFASPSHAFLIHIQEHVESPSETFTVTTKVHLRYAPPQEDSDFWPILIPPPVLLAATATNSRRTIHALPSAANPLIIWTATGHVGDFAVVLSVTIIVSLVGTAFMIRDIARATKWI